MEWDTPTRHDSLYRHLPKFGPFLDAYHTGLTSAGGILTSKHPSYSMAQTIDLTWLMSSYTGPGSPKSQTDVGGRGTTAATSNIYQTVNNCQHFNILSSLNMP